MNIKQLEYIVVTAKCGSLHKAANKLFISQPNISKAIKAVEEELNITIFNRSSKGIELTDVGIEFVRNAQNLLEHRENFENFFKNRIYIEAKKNFIVYSHYYTPVTAAFSNMCVSKEADNLNMELFQTSSATDILFSVINNKANIGILTISHYNKVLFDQYVKKHDLYYEVLHSSSSYYIQLSLNHPLASSSSISLEDLKPYPLVQIGVNNKENIGLIKSIDLFYEVNNLFRLNNKLIKVWDFFSFMSVLNTTNGFACGVDFFREGGEVSKSTNIVSREAADISYSFYVCVVYKKNNPMQFEINSIKSRIENNIKSLFEN